MSDFQNRAQVVFFSYLYCFFFFKCFVRESYSNVKRNIILRLECRMDVGEMEDGQKMESESDINRVDDKFGEQEPPPSMEDKDSGEDVQSPPPLSPSAKDENPGENLETAPSQAASDVKSDESPSDNHATDVKTVAEVETDVDASGVNELEAVTPHPLAKSAIPKDEDGSEGEFKNQFNDKAVILATKKKKKLYELE